MCLLILLLIFLLKKLNQPYLIAYVIAGVVLGPDITDIFSDPDKISSLGEVGTLFLMFFLGIEIAVPDNKTLLIKPLIAQAIKTILGFLFAFLTGKWLGWGNANVLLLTVLLAFNSTAVVSEFLKSNRDIHTPVGKMVLNMLLIQDIMVGPAFTLFQFMNGNRIDFTQKIFAIAACLLIFLLLKEIRNRNLFQLHFFSELKQDHELQVFAGTLICLGFALLASYIGLTPAVGSFVAGVYIGRTNAFNWLENVLRPFKIFFVALFFVSVGLMIDLSFIRTHYLFILLTGVAVLAINSLFTAAVFRGLKFPARDSLYGGALLSQTGEFGLLACSLAYQLGIIDLNFFKSALAITGLSLLLSTIWMTALRNFIYTK
jgi:CPA2 family monovalent cation:H+ antiporter-2